MDESCKDLKEKKYCFVFFSEFLRLKIKNIPLRKFWLRKTQKKSHFRSLYFRCYEVNGTGLRRTAATFDTILLSSLRLLINQKNSKSEPQLHLNHTHTFLHFSSGRFP